MYLSYDNSMHNSARHDTVTQKLQNTRQFLVDNTITLSKI